MHALGYAHRDFGAQNLYYDPTHSELFVTDFETLVPYPSGYFPALRDSYDVTGIGLDSPHRTLQMGYAAEHPLALARVLGVALEEGINELRASLLEELRAVSATFQKRGTRHALKVPRVYCAFSTAQFSVSREDAQRDAARRLQRFGITEQSIRGKRVLDLGCNHGAVLLQLASYEPAVGVGIEYDIEKVEVAKRIAALSGIAALRFRQADVDALEADGLDPPYDVVFCLALEAHLQRPDRLYPLLRALTGGTLCFEANAGACKDEVVALLIDAGFHHVEFLGMCDDDLIADNNHRPLFLARSEAT